MKQKFCCLATISSNRFEGVKGEAFNPKNTKPVVRHGAGSIILWDCCAASGSATQKKVNRIMKKEDYLQILQENLKSSAEDCVLGVPTGQ